MIYNIQKTTTQTTTTKCNIFTEEMIKKISLKIRIKKVKEQ